MTPQWYLDRYVEAVEREARKPKMRQVGWLTKTGAITRSLHFEGDQPVFVLERGE